MTSFWTSLLVVVSLGRVYRLCTKAPTDFTKTEFSCTQWDMSPSPAHDRRPRLLLLLLLLLTQATRVDLSSASQWIDHGRLYTVVQLV